MKNILPNELLGNAILNGDAKSAVKLIEDGARLDLTGAAGWYFELIAYCGSLELAELILQTHPNYDPVCLLNEAFQLNDKKFAVWLINKGVDINTAHEKGNIIRPCVRHGSIKIIKAAFSAGLKYNTGDYAPWFETGGFKHADALNTVMSYVFPGEPGKLAVPGLKAVQYDDKVKLGKILKKLKSINSGSHIITAFFICAMTAHKTAFKCAALLKEYGADVNAQDEYGRTAAFYKVSVYEDGVKMVLDTLDIFVKLGGNLHLADKQGRTILSECMADNKYKTLDKILQLRADITSFDRLSYFCWLASMPDNGEKIKMLKLLVKAGYDVKSFHGVNNPLDFAQGKLKKFLRRVIQIHNLKVQNGIGGY